MTDFTALLQPDRGQPARDIHVVHPEGFADWLAGQPVRVRTAITANKVTGRAGNRAILPGEAADDWTMLLVCDEPLDSPWRIASLADTLPEGTYRLADGGATGAAGLGWLLAQHRFDRYRETPDATGPRVLLTPEPARIDETVRIAEAVALVRDLVDTPAGDLGPAELADAARALDAGNQNQHGKTALLREVILRVEQRLPQLRFLAVVSNLVDVVLEFRRFKHVYVLSRAPNPGLI